MSGNILIGSTSWTDKTLIGCGRFYPPEIKSAEARLRYGQLLRRAGRAADARRVLGELLDHARVAPGHYRKAQRDWLDAAERELAALR